MKTKEQITIDFGQPFGTMTASLELLELLDSVIWHNFINTRDDQSNQQYHDSLNAEILRQDIQSALCYYDDTHK